MKILVTGGAGLVGSYVVDKLVDSHQVVILDNLEYQKGGIPYLNPKAGFINGDITDVKIYEKLKEHNFDIVYHTAAQTSGEASHEDPKLDIMVNAYGTALVAKFCKDNNIKQLIYTSTSAMYGSVSDSANEDTPIETRSVYGVSKFAGELFIKQYLLESDCKYTFFRLCNNYGPGENLNFTKKGMVSIYCNYIWKNKNIKVRGSMDRIRDFLYVEDTAEALVMALDNSKAFNQVYMLSSDSPVTVKELVDKILKHSNNTSMEVDVIDEVTPGDAFKFTANIDKIKKELGWYPKHSLDEGIKKYFDWINQVPVVEDLSNYHPFKMRSSI